MQPLRRHSGEIIYRANEEKQEEIDNVCKVFKKNLSITVGTKRKDLENIPFQMNKQHKICPSAPKLLPQVALPIIPDLEI